MEMGGLLAILARNGPSVTYEAMTINVSSTCNIHEAESSGNRSPISSQLADIFTYKCPNF
jgi:hypothetical protein